MRRRAQAGPEGEAVAGVPAGPPRKRAGVWHPGGGEAMVSIGSSASPIFARQLGEGEPLVLLHGLMLTGEMFEPVLGAFARHHRVIVPDLRGRGRSSGLPGPYTAERMAEDLAELLEAYGIPDANVLGYSRGGAVAQQFARNYPERTRRLVLVCSYVCHGSSVLERLENRLLLRAVRLLGTGGAARIVARVAALPHPGGMSISPETARWLQGMLASGDKESSVRAVRAMSAFDSRGWLGQIDCPTLVLCGSKDMLASRTHCEMLAGGIKGACLHTVEDAGHTLPWTHQERFVELTERWLSASPEI